MNADSDFCPIKPDDCMFTYYSEAGLISKGALSDAPNGFYVFSMPAEDCLNDSYGEFNEKIYRSLNDLGKLLIERIFGDASLYYFILCLCPRVLIEGGFNPEIPLDCNKVAGYAKRFSVDWIHRVVYLEDLKYLTDSFLETYNQAIDSLRVVFRALCEVDIIGIDKDGVYITSSPQTHRVMREVEFFIIRFYSSLDILSRLLYELSCIPDQFDSYNKIKSDKSTLYSKLRTRGLHAGEEGHIFNKSPEVTYLEELRNEIIHNRAFKVSASCYVRIEKGTVAERFFLLPDAVEDSGRLTRWNGRSRFYSQEKNGSKCIAGLYQQISTRIVNSLNWAIDDLSSEVDKMRQDGKFLVVDSGAVEAIVKSINDAFRY